MEADFEQFKINPNYYEAIPRPTKEERRALDLKMIEKGQLEPIVVNPNMVILDGHTRYDILLNRGKKIKYIIREFESDLLEAQYVVECNVMRRQLNNYQRLEALYGLYKQRKDDLKSKNYNGWISVMKSIKRGNNTASLISIDIEYHKQAVNKISRELEEKYYIRRTKAFKKYEQGRGRGGTTYHILTLLPKAEEFLSTHKRREKGSASQFIGEITGMNRNTVTRGMTIIEMADDDMKKKLRGGSLNMTKAFAIVIGLDEKRDNSKYMNARLQCPHCDHIDERQEFKKILREQH